MAFLNPNPQPASGSGAVPISGVYVGNAPDSYMQLLEPNDNNVSWAGTQVGVGTWVVQPIVVPHIGAFSAVDIFLSQTYSATNAGSSQAQSLSVSLGLYTVNGSTLSLLSSVSVSTLASVTGSTSSISFNGVKNFPIAWNLPLSPGNYWVAMASSTASGGNAIAAAVSNVVYSFAGGASGYKGIYGSSTFASQARRLGEGQLSVTSSAAPVSMAFSDIAGSLAGNTNNPVVNFKNFTA